MGAYEPDWDAIDAEVDPPEPDDVYLARVTAPLPTAWLDDGEPF